MGVGGGGGGGLDGGAQDGFDHVCECVGLGARVHLEAVNILAELFTI